MFSSSFSCSLSSSEFESTTLVALVPGSGSVFLSCFGSDALLSDSSSAMVVCCACLAREKMGADVGLLVFCCLARLLRVLLVLLVARVDRVDRVALVDLVDITEESEARVSSASVLTERMLESSMFCTFLVFFALPFLATRLPFL